MATEAHSFEYIVVGAGSAGCVVAGRLGRRAHTLLIEAGGPDTGIQNGQDIGALISTPDDVMLTWATAIARPYLTEPESRLGRRPMAVHQGVVRGGCHSINGMIYIRGNHRDYDGWAQLGNEGWSYREVLPYFRASEVFDERPLRYDADDLHYHGAHGPLHVRPLPNPTPFAGSFIEGARELDHRGSRPSHDFNGHEQENSAGLYQ